jgi:hypothetical protein
METIHYKSKRDKTPLTIEEIYQDYINKYGNDSRNIETYLNFHYPDDEYINFGDNDKRKKQYEDIEKEELTKRGEKQYFTTKY